MSTYRWGAFLAAASIVAFQCFVPPIVGLADNADFLIIASRFSMDVTNPEDPDRFFSFLNNHYAHSDRPAWVPAVLSSEMLLVLPGYLLSTLVSKTGHYDIRWAGVTHAAIFLWAIYWILPLLEPLSRWPRRIATSLMILILTDVVYVAYFNSLYTDAASFVTLIALLAAIARFISGHDQTRRGIYLMVLFAVLFTTSKVQHAFLGLPILAFLAWCHEPIRLSLGRRGGILVLLPIAAGMSVMAATTTPRYKGMALYNVVFSHILPHAYKPAVALRELGLPERYVTRNGTHSYTTGGIVFDPLFEEEWNKEASFGMLALYYLRHPFVPFSMLRMGVAASRIQRPTWGNFFKSEGLPAYTRSQAFAWWSWAKQSVFKNHHFTHLGFSVFPSLLLLWAMHARAFAELHCARPAAYLLISMAFAELMLGSLTDVLDTSRHLFLYNAIQDVIVVVVIVLICYACQRKAISR